MISMKLLLTMLGVSALATMGVVFSWSIRDGVASFPGANGRIAFVSNRESGDYEIYAATIGGTVTRLTYSLGLDTHPVWSPDGARIAFTSYRNGSSQIFVMNADGTSPTQLTNGPEDNNPSWSPDGSKIAFNRWSQIYVMNADGTAQTNLTNSASSDAYPDWSPDGTKIAFQSNRAGGDRIFLMNADGSAQVEVVPYGNTPSWSPDGAKLAFFYRPPDQFPNGSSEIFTADANGMNVTRLTNNAHFDSQPVWSPDGSKIAFHTVRPEDNDRDEIYLMNADGSNQVNATNDPDFDGVVDWQPLPSTPSPMTTPATTPTAPPPVGGEVEITTR